MKVLIRCVQGVLILMLLPLSPVLASDVIVMPEPGTMILLGTALAGLAGYNWYKERKK